jgi:hypothetical protein
MRGERLLLRAGEKLVGVACCHLPPEMRDERCREWVAELPVILHDPAVRPALARAALVSPEAVRVPRPDRHLGRESVRCGRTYEVRLPSRVGGGLRI